MNSSFSIKFYLNKNKGKGEQFKIYGRLIHDRKKSEFATNYYIDENNWDDLRGRAKKDQVINDELSELEVQVNRIRSINTISRRKDLQPEILQILLFLTG